MAKEVEIKETAEKEAALAIAKSLSDFFNSDGINSLTEDLKTHKLFGAFLDGNIVGFVTLRIADVGSLEISWLAVLVDFQGRGIGSSLVRESVKKFSTEGFEVCYVKTLAETVEDEGYAKTRKFYKNLGFQTLEIIDPYPKWQSGNPCQILAARLPLSDSRT